MSRINGTVRRAAAKDLQADEKLATVARRCLAAVGSAAII